MNNIIKKKGKSIKKLELHNKENMKIFEKKPKNGGTPAIEKRDIIRTLEKKFEEPRSKKEYNVL